MYLKDLEAAKITNARVTAWGELLVKVRGINKASEGRGGRGWCPVRLPKVIRDALVKFGEYCNAQTIKDPFPVGPRRPFRVLFENHTDSRDDEVRTFMARTEEEALYRARQGCRENYCATRVLQKGE